MKTKLKRLLAAAMAAYTCAAIAIPLDASAYICGDVNNDGTVSMSDQVALNKYLAGIIELVNYEAADLTGNGIINVVDAKIMAKYQAMQITSLPYPVTTE